MVSRYFLKGNITKVKLFPLEGTFLSEVSNRETIAVIKANYATCCLQKRIEKFPLLIPVKIILKYSKIKFKYL